MRLKEDRGDSGSHVIDVLAGRGMSNGYGINPLASFPITQNVPFILFSGTSKKQTSNYDEGIG